MSNLLPVSQLVNVSVNLSPIPAQAQSLSNILILGTSGVIDGIERKRQYATLAAVAEDFGTTSEEYLSAQAWFAQSPQPTNILIGQWFSPASVPTFSNPRLVGAATATSLSQWQAITNGSFKYDDSVVSPTDITGLDFSLVTNLNGVANIVETAINTILGSSIATVTWDAVYSRFTLEVADNRSLQFVTDAATGTSIGALLGWTNDNGCYVVPSYTSETAIEAVVDFDDRFGQQWYAVFIPSATDEDHIAVAGYIEGSNTKHFYAINSQDAGIISSVDTANIAYQVKELGYKKTAVQYSSKSKYAAVSFVSRILTTDYTANNTVITLMYKQEPGIIAEELSMTQAAAAKANYANIFVKYDNSTAIVQYGTVASGEFVDTIIGADWLAITIQNDVYNLLYTSTTKIPQTNDGHNLIATVITRTLEQGVANGLLAPGVWDTGGFGTLKQGDYLSKGYYVYWTPVELQNPADRAARKSTTFQVAAKLAGAIHTVSVQININR
jgi:hypothetical protein